MVVLPKPKSVLAAGFTCVCGHHLPGTPLYRITCPACRQTYVREVNAQ